MQQCNYSQYYTCTREYNIPIMEIMQTRMYLFFRQIITNAATGMPVNKIMDINRI